MRATFLGTAAGDTSVSRDHSGTLLESGGDSILLDCGGNIARHFRAGELSADLPGAVWLSHMHSDHVGQFSMLIQSLWLRQRRKPLHVFGPPEVVRVMQDFLVRCILFPELVGFPVEWHAVKPGVAVEFGPFTLTAFATDHLASLAQQFQKNYPATCFQCYGCAIDVAGRRYVYSADIAHPDDLAPALEGREVAGLICELAHYSEDVLFRELASYDIKAIWITHYPDTFAGQEKKLKVAAREAGFRGDIHLVEDKIAEDI